MGPNFSTNPLVASLKAASSRAEIRIAPETLIARSVLFSHRPYTVARETPSCAANSRTESRRSGVGGISEPLGTCSKPAARNFHLPVDLQRDGTPPLQKHSPPAPHRRDASYLPFFSPF